MEFGKAMSMFRKSKGLKQGELADIIGVSRQSICYWENGKYVPAPEHVRLVAKALDVDADWLEGCL